MLCTNCNLRLVGVKFLTFVETTVKKLLKRQLESQPDAIWFKNWKSEKLSV